MHVHRVQLTGIDELFDFGDRDPPGRSAERIEILRTHLVDEIAVSVSVARVHKSEISANAALENVSHVVEVTGFLSR